MEIFTIKAPLSKVLYNSKVQFLSFIIAIILHYPPALLSRLVYIELLPKVFASQSKSHMGGHTFLSLVLGLSQKPQGTRGHEEPAEAKSVPLWTLLTLLRGVNAPWALPLLRVR